MRSSIEDLIAFFKTDSLRETMEGRLFVLVTGFAMLGLFWGVFYLTDSYLLSALGAFAGPVIYIWRLVVTIGKSPMGDSAQIKRQK